MGPVHSIPPMSQKLGNKAVSVNRKRKHAYDLYSYLLHYSFVLLKIPTQLIVSYVCNNSKGLNDILENLWN